MSFFYPFFLALTRQSFSENNEMFWKTRMQAVFIRWRRIHSIKISLLSKTFLNCKKNKKKSWKNRACPTKNPSTRKKTWKNISEILLEPRQKREEHRRKKRKCKNKCTKTGMLRLSTFIHTGTLNWNEKKNTKTNEPFGVK